MKIAILLLSILFLLSNAQWQFNSLRYKIYVKDLEKIKEYYEKTLNMSIIYDIDSLCILDPHIPDTVVQIVKSPESNPPRGSSLLFQVKDVTKYWNNLKTKVNVTTPLQQTRFGLYFAFNDLNGLSIGYYQARNPRGEETQVVIHTPNFDRRLAFYTNLIGLKVVEQWNNSPRDRGAIMQMGPSTRLEVIARNSSMTNSIRVSHKVADVWKLWAAIKDKVRVIYALRENPW